MVSTELVLGTTVLTLGLATLVGIRYSRGRISSVEDYVSAPDVAGTAPLTASLIASTIGTWVLFSPAEAAVEFGGVTAVLGYAVGLALPLAGFAVVGVRIRRLVPHGHSVTAFVRARYGRAMHALVLVVSGVYMFVFLAVELTGIAAALAIVAGTPPALTAGLVGLFVFAYTGYGGLIASLVTDTVQALVMLPLLAIGVVSIFHSLGGTGALYGRILASEPALLALDNPTGLRFGLYVGIALLGANVLNQGIWQRVYAAEDEATLRQSFLAAGIGVVPVVFLAGLLGLGAVGLDTTLRHPHTAFFRVLLATEPTWLVVVVVVLMVLIVMSSADTLLSGLAALALDELPLVLERVERDTDDAALRWVRVLTGVLALAATAVGAAQLSEIRLFLTADLLSAATFVPVVAGLYTGEIPEWGGVAASLSGFAVGLVFDPALRWLWLAVLPAPLGVALPTPSFAVSFGLAVGISAAFTAGTALVSDGTTDLEDLEGHVRRVRERRDRR